MLTAVICCCVKHKNTRGRIIHPNRANVLANGLQAPNNTHNNVFIVPTSAAGPPAYSSNMYGTNPNMAYPPPPPAYYPSTATVGTAPGTAGTGQGGFASAMPPAYGMHGGVAGGYPVTQPPAYSAVPPIPKTQTTTGYVHPTAIVTTNTNNTAPPGHNNYSNPNPNSASNPFAQAATR